MFSSLTQQRVILIALLLWALSFALFRVWKIGRGVPPQQSAVVASIESWGEPAPVPVLATPTGNPYIEIDDSCNWAYAGTCVNLRSGPGTSYPVVMQLRTNMVLKVASTTVVDGRTWYKIGFDGEVHYPERVKSDWYVAGDYARLFYDSGMLATTTQAKALNTKRIVIDRAKEMLYAYDGDTLFMEQAISVGLELTPTPTGTFSIYRKMPDSYMQGPVPGVSDQYYDLPGVPWDLYFTNEGGAIHGAYWHNNFGQPWSHGCVNLPPAAAELLYEWADLGTPVTVKD
ncbi:MAG: L,D-transpeptidase family protein [Candidatus Parcubacteria bacterium]|nr:L,D-transpeptidase family protein [Candidatus Parcubacteria bacterium]